MGILTDTKGNISLFRVSLAIGAAGGLLLLAGILSFTLDQESRRSPFFVDLPPGAQTWGSADVYGAGLQRVYYQVPGGDVETVAQFYGERMRSHYGTGQNDPLAERCNRFPPTGEFPDYVPGSGRVPFYWTCMFDRGGLNMQQSTLVTIQPGVLSADPLRNSEGAVVIVYEQRWQP